MGAEAALVSWLADHAAVLSAAHDVSDGGLAVALAELALWSGVGASVEIGEDALDWFGEGGGLAVVACRPEDVAGLADTVPLREIGRVGGGQILGLTLDRLHAAHDGGDA